MRSLFHSSPKEAAAKVEDMEEEKYEMGAVRQEVVKEKYLGTVDDKSNMQMLGRLQELRRNFGFLSIMGFGSTLICTWEALLASAGSVYINGGTAGLFWGYIFVAIGLFLAYLSLAELASMAPTSGGQYHWVSEFAPRSCQKYLSYLTGWLSFISWQASPASISFLAAIVIQGVIALNDETYVVERWHATLLIIGLVTFAVFFNTYLARRLPVVEGILLIVHVLGLFAIIIPLWIMAPRNNADDAFTQFLNNGGWPTTGLSFMVGLNPLVYSLLGFDSVVHMSEEVKDASRTLPQSLIWSKVLNAVAGLIVIITLIFTWGDMEEVAATPTGLPFVQIFYNATQSLAGTTIMATIVIVALFSSAIAVVATASRQLWSFARDNGTPFSATIARVKHGWDIPLNSVIVSLITAALLSLINIGSTAALNAMFSITVGAQATTYSLSIFCVLLKRLRGEPLPARRWSLGGLGIYINIAALMFLFIIFIFCFFPAATPVDAETMNYGALMYGAVIILATTYYIFIGRKVYVPPVERVRRGNPA